MKLKRLLLGGLLGLGLTAYALAQSTPLYNWLGTETFRITLGSGSVTSIDLNSVRNTQGVNLVAAATTVNTTPTGFIPTAGYYVASGAITTWGVWLPNPANQGQKFCVSNGTSSDFTSNTTVLPQSGTQSQTLNSTFTSQTVAAGASACWVFNMTSNTVGVWFRVQ